MMKVVFLFNFLGPGMLSMCLTMAILTPQDIVPFWPLYIVIPASLALTVFSQRVSRKRFYPRHKRLRMAGTTALVSGLLLGPWVYIFLVRS